MPSKTQSSWGAPAFDRRTEGTLGHALQRAVPALGLFAEDRLEPHDTRWGAASFDDLRVFPVWVLFWRPGNQTHALHRNPLFDARLGVTLQLLMIDALHTLHLGALKEWTMHALWLLTRKNAWRLDAATSDVLRDASVFLQYRHELLGWYKAQRPRRAIYIYIYI